MPTRLIREGILKSPRVNELDPPAEVFYRRLMSVVDDHGLFEAHPAILRADLFPLRVDKVREADISRWIAACEKAGLIALYEAGGKNLGQMLDTKWQTRSAPKFPLPPWGSGAPPESLVNGCEQVPATVYLGGDVVVVEDEGGKPRKRGARAPEKALPEGFTISDRVRDWAKEKGYGRLDEHLEAFVRKCKANDYRYRDWDAAFMNAIAEDWGKVTSRPPPARPSQPRASLLEQLERDAKAAGLTRGFDESTPAFRARVDAQLAGAH